ncbi:MAG: D-2-hydroxyacid dehydrogenase [Polaromonas sp.]|nr:D-2-hydroxyacid dehydrogenase [Polaromonas sp.]
MSEVATRRGGALLVTAEIASTCADRLKPLLAGRVRLQVLQQGQRPKAEELSDVQAAFLSTDLMKTSNKQVLNQALAAFAFAVENAPALRWLHTCASGTDRPLLQGAMRRGVAVTSSAGANAGAVSHSAIAGMLALARNLPAWVRDQDARRWSSHGVPPDLESQHAVVVGLGAVGTRVSRVCRSLGLRVTGVRRRRLPIPECNAVITLEELSNVLPDADWLFLCCPLTPQTQDLVNAELLARLPVRASLINVARGEVVNEPALFDAMYGGRLAGVYSDVFVQEPLPAESPWWTLPRTLVSPHAAGQSAGFAPRTVDMFLDNLGRWMNGQELLNVATAEAE